MISRNKKVYSIYLILLFCCPLFITNIAPSQTLNTPLKVIIIRHGEKAPIGDNLNCKGFNRAQLLPAVIVSKFSIPDFSYVPSLTSDSATKHARMFQTITPLAVKYNLTVNSKFNGKDSEGVTNDILKKQGTVLIVWDHKSIVPIIHAFGIIDPELHWRDDDFDSIWIITFINGKAMLSKDAEGLSPSVECR